MSIQVEANSDTPIAVSQLAGYCMGDAAFAISLLHKFEQQINKDIAELDKCLVAHETSKLAATAHTLKSTAAAVAAHGLHELAKTIEELARKDNLDNVDCELTKLRHEVERCRAYLPTARKTLLSTALRLPSDRR